MCNATVDSSPVQHTLQKQSCGPWQKQVAWAPLPTCDTLEYETSIAKLKSVFVTALFGILETLISGRHVCSKIWECINTHQQLSTQEIPTMHPIHMAYVKRGYHRILYLGRLKKQTETAILSKAGHWKVEYHLTHRKTRWLKTPMFHVCCWHLLTWALRFCYYDELKVFPVLGICVKECRTINRSCLYCL